MPSSFRDLVGEALDSLPEAIARHLDNVEVVVEDEPPEELLSGLSEGDTLLGHYHGIPLTERGVYDGALPDKISIYQGPITRSYRSPEAIRDEVRRTVIHELGHYFGIDDERLDELGWS